MQYQNALLGLKKKTFLRGWVANEIFRRVHPESSTIGDFSLQNPQTSFTRGVSAIQGIRASRGKSLHWSPRG